MSLRSDPITSFTLPYHPEYGLDDSTRVEVLRLVVDWKATPVEAARVHKIGVSTVYKWLAAARRSASGSTPISQKDL
jgi:hypothetical protein